MQLRKELIRNKVLKERELREMAECTHHPRTNQNTLRSYRVAKYR